MAARSGSFWQSGDDCLIPILFLGPNGDRRIPRAVERLLFRGEHLLCRSGQLAVFAREGRTYGLLESEEWDRLQWRQGLVVIKEGVRTGLLPPGTAVGGFVVSQEDAAWLHQAGGGQGQVISCGMSLRDTLTYASCESSQPVVSLLRPLHGPYGRPTDPQDLPLPAGISGGYTLLAAAAVALFLGLSPAIPPVESEKSDNKNYPL